MWDFDYSDEDESDKDTDISNMFQDDEDFWKYFERVFLRNNLTLKSLSDIAKLVNKKPGNCNQLPNN